MILLKFPIFKIPTVKATKIVKWNPYLTSVFLNSLKIAVSVKAAMISGSPAPSGGVSLSSALTSSWRERSRISSVVEVSPSEANGAALAVVMLLVDFVLIGGGLSGAADFPVGVAVGDAVKLLDDEERDRLPMDLSFGEPAWKIKLFGNSTVRTLYKNNEQTHLSNYQSINQSINGSIDRSTDQAVPNQSINQSAAHTRSCNYGPCKNRLWIAHEFVVLRNSSEKEIVWELHSGKVVGKVWANWLIKQSIDQRTNQSINQATTIYWTT